jgi:hypothetical protein
MQRWGLLCPRYQGEMKIIAFIEAEDVIEKILRHLGLWETHIHDPPAAKTPHIPELTYTDDNSQVPSIDYCFQ